MKILCIHGVGHQEANLDWEAAWKDAIVNGLSTTHPDLNPDSLDISFTDYDSLFVGPVNNLSPRDIVRAVTLLGGGVLHRAFTLPNVVDGARWTAGMVIVWVENADVRQQALEKFRADVQRINPDLICAHSLGTLISYDAFRRDATLLNDNRTYVTFGCQLGNLFVRGQFGGRVEPFTQVGFWYDLYNAHDHVFTAPLDFGPFQTASNFLQVHTDFGSDWPWPLNHDAVSPDPANAPDKGYLTHPDTVTQVWARIGVPTEAPAAVGVGAAAATRSVVAPGSLRVKEFTANVIKTPDAPTHRALLVGINDYPDPANRLEGCLNDVFLMSSVLQECGFKAEDIRVVFDDRATAAGILERLHWLLDGTAPGDQRFFFYSGHGAQLPSYGVDGKIRRVDACLVPYDFAWSYETAITDDRLVNLYSQLPYDARFMMVLDSCYSGGMTRGSLCVRGLVPPDDIRHQMLRWDAQEQMWTSRDLPPANADLASSPKGRKFVGSSGAEHLLGRAVSLRTLPSEQCKKVSAALKHQGPYLPMVYEACGEKEYATEYQHGVTSYGAFTYAMATILRRQKGTGKRLTFRQLEGETARVLDELHYQQHPVLVGPDDLLDKDIPWDGFGGKEGNK